MPRPIPIPQRTRNEGRSAVVSVRLRPEERAALISFAARHDASLSGLLATLGLQVASGGGEQVAILCEASPAFREIAFALSRVGNNLNQIAKSLHTGGDPEVLSDLVELRELLNRLRTEVLSWG